MVKRLLSTDRGAAHSFSFSKASLISFSMPISSKSGVSYWLCGKSSRLGVKLLQPELQRPSPAAQEGLLGPLHRLPLHRSLEDSEELLTLQTQTAGRLVQLDYTLEELPPFFTIHKTADIKAKTLTALGTEPGHFRSFTCTTNAATLANVASSAMRRSRLMLTCLSKKKRAQPSFLAVCGG
ncbi:hypothetical protein EYF80_026078 [Liparis tanakae]|uniref:Uncharacterized protein n=1 Tax=Liparis tanakae TaxID=230148 RepID=A0A4Z2HDP7_9TELE|nr:hypothetical protein EYF80_026078 [Liparis tanakae]